MSFLTSEAGRIKSQLIASLSGKISSKAAFRSSESKDPFKKVKDLIQALIERLLKEAAEEATKKGFCHMEVNKCIQERDARLADVQKLNTQVGALESKKEELEAHVEMLTEAISELEDALSSNTKIRNQEKAENEKDLKMAKEALPAIKKAIEILKEYYKKAEKSFIQASPWTKTPLAQASKSTRASRTGPGVSSA